MPEYSDWVRDNARALMQQYIKDSKFKGFWSQWLREKYGQLHGGN